MEIVPYVSAFENVKNKIVQSSYNTSIQMWFNQNPLIRHVDKFIKNLYPIEDVRNFALTIMIYPVPMDSTLLAPKPRLRPLDSLSGKPFRICPCTSINSYDIARLFDFYDAQGPISDFGKSTLMHIQSYSLHESTEFDLTLADLPSKLIQLLLKSIFFQFDELFPDTWFVQTTLDLSTITSIIKEGLVENDVLVDVYNQLVAMQNDEKEKYYYLQDAIKDVAPEWFEPPYINYMCLCLDALDLVDHGRTVFLSRPI